MAVAGGQTTYQQAGTSSQQDTQFQELETFVQRLEHDVHEDDLAWPSYSEALAPHGTASNR